MIEVPGLKVRAATPSDVPAVGACLASAFFDDPLWGHWAFPDEAQRRTGLLDLMGFWASAGVRRPWVRMTPGAETVAVWIPPGETEMTGPEEAAFDELLEALFGERIREVQSLFSRFEACHPRAEPHYYLSLWATDRAHAGRGLGTALMQDNLAVIDAERMPAYLESTNPANIGRYETLGFRIQDHFAARNGPVVTTMWRAAR